MRTRSLPPLCPMHGTLIVPFKEKRVVREALSALTPDSSTATTGKVAFRPKGSWPASGLRHYSASIEGYQPDNVAPTFSLIVLIGPPWGANLSECLWTAQYEWWLAGFYSAKSAIRSFLSFLLFRSSGFASEWPPSWW